MFCVDQASLPRVGGNWEHPTAKATLRHAYGAGMLGKALIGFGGFAYRYL